MRYALPVRQNPYTFVQSVFVVKIMGVFSLLVAGCVRIVQRRLNMSNEISLETRASAAFSQGRLEMLLFIAGTYSP